MATTYPICELCRTLGASRSGYYAWRRGGRGTRARADRALGPQIAEMHRQSRSTYGSPRITRDLHAQGIRCGHNRIARLMRKMGLVGAQKARFRPKTTDSGHDLPVSPHRLADLEAVTRPNQVWVSDITYLRTRTGWVYLCAVMDLCTRTIKGVTVRSSLKSSLAVDTLRSAAFRYKPGPGLIVHSDRGSQYAAHSFRDQLDAMHALGSMGRTGCCYDNAAMESFWSTLKTELPITHLSNSEEDARIAIFDYTETFYNPRRRHSSLGYLSPFDFESQLMATTFDPHVSALSG
jgi:putative transposase